MVYKVDKKKLEEGLIEFMKQQLNELEKMLNGFDVNSISEIDLERMAHDTKLDGNYILEYGRIFEDYFYPTKESFKNQDETRKYTGEGSNMIVKKLIEIQDKVREFRLEKGIEEPKIKFVIYQTAKEIEQEESKRRKA